MTVNPRTIRAGLRTLLKSGVIGDAPIHLQIEPSSYCNYRCLMCDRRAIPNPSHMPVAKFRAIIEQCRPFFVTLSGYGEPLLHPDLPEMIRLVKEKGAGVNTTTNGFLLGRRAQELVDSGLDTINISLDAATADSYSRIRRNSHFDKVISNIGKLRAARGGRSAPHMRATFVIQRHNLDELIPFLDLARNAGFDAVLFQPLLLFDMEDALYSELAGDVDETALREALEKARTHARRLGMPGNLDRLIQRLDDFLAVQYRKHERPVLLKQCAKPWFSAYISVEGDLRPCCSFAPIAMRFGNVFETDILEIMNGARAREFRKRLKQGRPPHSLCSRCVPESLWDLMRTTSF